jgi:hypothetical protein
MADVDWGRIGAEAAISLLSGVGGLFVGVWRWGRRSAVHDQKVKDDYDGKINELREQMRAALAKHDEAADARVEALVAQFKESFEGIRRQIDDHRLEAERRFLPREGLTDFRKEYREDMANLMKKIDHITVRADRQ